MAKRRRLVVANWKMYGRLTSGLMLAQDITNLAEAARPLNFDMVLCPPATLTWAVGEALMGTSVMLGAQDCHTATHGAYTGDISAAMLADLGCRYVILGHSERRRHRAENGPGENDALIAQKIEAAQLAGLTAILCVGETAAELAEDATIATIQNQLRHSLHASVKLSHLVIAYEPVWAIGTGQQPEPDDIATVHRAIRKHFGNVGETMRVLYGGSVNPSNSEALLKQDEIDGFLVGGASLNAEGLWAIAQSCGE